MVVVVAIELKEEVLKFVREKVYVIIGGVGERGEVFFLRKSLISIFMIAIFFTKRLIMGNFRRRPSKKQYNHKIIE